MCRSPIAEVLLRQKLQQRVDGEDWRVESAGTWTLAGKPVAILTQEVMQQLYGIDLSTHRTRLVSRPLLRPFDLILVMEVGQKEAIRVEFPELASRVYLLYEMVGQIRNVGDPIGGTTKDFADTAHEIDDLLTRGLENMIRLARGVKPGVDG
jgi:protein-tyrosine phosphatase